MNKLITTLVVLSALSSTQAMAQDLSIKVKNLTSGMYFTPLLVAAHDDGNRLFEEGVMASSSLQAMAEGGDISGLSTAIQSTGANVEEDPAGGPLAPGANTTFSFTTDDLNNYLSLTAMLLPTNDGFVGADSIKIPNIAGTYIYYLNAYDAGTEINDEIVNGAGAAGNLGIPVDPGSKNGSNGTGMATTEANNKVHIHRGNIGDTDASGGKSDLDSTVHRWLNPVAQLIITVQ